MLQHNLKIIFRQLKKQWLFTGIHTVGLTVGFACCLLIFLFIRYEMSFDRHHPNADRTYRITMITNNQGELDYSSNTPYPFGEAFRADFPDAEHVGMVHFNGSTTFIIPNQEVVELEEVLFAEQNILEMFAINLVEANTDRPLDQPGSGLLSQSTAARLFDGQAIGQTLELSDTVLIEIVGIYEDLPSTTHLQADALVSYASLTSDLVGFNIEEWGVSIGGSTYVTLPEGTSSEQYTADLEAFATKYMFDEELGLANEINLQPIGAIHFDTRFGSSGSPVRPIQSIYLWVFGSVGLLILLMACFNFVNLSLAQSIRKSQEVGMRKVLGAGRRQLWFQYWGEAVVLASLAAVFSHVIAQLTLPGINALLDKQMDIAALVSLPVLLFSGLVLVLISLLAGGYPAWSLARKEPKQVLQGSKLVGARGEGRLRSAMVLAQFVITLLIIIGAVTVARQVQFMQQKDLGFNKDAIIQVSLPDPGQNSTLATEWLRHPAVEEVSFTLGAPTSRNNIHTTFYPKGADPSSSIKRVGIKATDPNYQATYGLHLASGRYLNDADARKVGDGFPEGEVNVVVNETLIRQMGYAEATEAIGEKMIVSINNIEAEIVGVLQDFNTTSLREAVEPIILMPMPALYYQAGLKIDPNQLNNLLPVLENSWNEQYEGALFEYTFLDETIAEQYSEEQRIFGLLQVFAGLAIFIACLGLFGLSAIMVGQRQKEIGLRKVLGASVAGLVGLLSKDMLRLVLVALVIAAPVAWWLMNGWLENFAYRVAVGWWVFLLAGFVLLLIAFLTISGQALKAALANPVKALRSE